MRLFQISPSNTDSIQNHHTRHGIKAFHAKNGVADVGYGDRDGLRPIAQSINTSVENGLLDHSVSGERSGEERWA